MLGGSHEPADRRRPHSGHTLRFRVRNANDEESAIWSVIGEAATDDVYLCIRDFMGEIGLDLGRDTWQLAMSEYGAQRIPDGEGRMRVRWAPDLGRGWYRGATVIVPSCCIHHLPPPPTGDDVATLSAPPPGWGLRFDVLLGTADRESLSFTGVEEVGQLALSDDNLVRVVATELPIDATYERGIISMCRGIERQGRCASGPRGWAWGVDDGEGGPVLVDLGPIDRAAA